MADRLSDLARFLREASRKAFRPGRHDCALFAADWLVFIDGPDLAASWRGDYRTLEEGLQRVRSDGFTSHVDVFDKSVLAPVASWMVSRPGDVALLRENGSDCLGIAGSDVVHVLRPGTGLDYVPLDRMRRGWRN